MDIEINGNTAFLKGRLDTAASADALKDLAPVFGMATETVVLDCTGLEYISSSGLRIFLMLRKEAAAKGGKVIVRGINDNIRNVFMMTGFINLFTFE